MKKKQINVSVDSETYFTFLRFYRGCLSRFVRNAIKLAIKDKDFFNLVFFSEVEKC